jgi:hypothetical protein
MLCLSMGDVREACVCMKRAHEMNVLIAQETLDRFTLLTDTARETPLELARALVQTAS